jgi:cbb3-type cytochrome oxidase maturation protein
MAILLFLIPISLLLLGVAVWAFVWSVRDGQFDDLDTAPLDILRDDPPPPPPPAGEPPTPAPDAPAPDKPRLHDAD